MGGVLYSPARSRTSREFGLPFESQIGSCLHALGHREHKGGCLWRRTSCGTPRSTGATCQGPGRVPPLPRQLWTDHGPGFIFDRNRPNAVFLCSLFSTSFFKKKSGSLLAKQSSKNVHQFQKCVLDNHNFPAGVHGRFFPLILTCWGKLCLSSAVGDPSS